jgi:hypothetical protein
MKKEWITRIWTFQEAVLATNIILVYGHETLSWDEFIRGALMLAKTTDVRVHSWLSLIKLWAQVERREYWNDKHLRRSIVFEVEGDRAVSGREVEELPVSTSIRTYQLGFVAGGYQKWFKRVSILASLIPISIVAVIAGGIIYGATKDDRYAFGFAFALAGFFFLFSLLLQSTSPIHFLDIQTAIDEHLPVSGQYGAVNPHSITTGVLRALRSRDAKMPIDKVNGLKGVLAFLDFPVKESPVSAKDPDSAQIAYHPVFVDLVRWSANHNPGTPRDPRTDQIGCLNLIMDAGLPGHPDVPSWVPMWDKSNLISWMYWEDEDYLLRPDAAPQFSSDLRQLTVQGMFVDSVSWCMADITSPRVSPGEGDELSNVRNLMTLVSRQHGNPEDVRLGILEVLYGWTKDRVPRARHPIYNKWYKVIQGRSGMPGVNIETGTDMHDSGTRALTLISKDQSIMNYHLERCGELAGKRKIVMTANGCLGTGSIHICPGDKIAQVNGVSMPLVLRSDEHQRWTLVGPLFLDHRSRDRKKPPKWNSITIS